LNVAVIQRKIDTVVNGLTAEQAEVDSGCFGANANLVE
jgi:hypothetical protein